MPVRSHSAFAAVLALALTPAIAQSAERFTMAPVDGGFVRLDKESGAMSMCTQGDGGWSCTPMDDDTTVREELETLKKENAELRAEVRRLEDTFVGGGRRPGAEGERLGEQSGPPGGLPPGGLPDFKLPSEEDVDQAVDYLESMIRKFRERFEDFGEKTDPDRPRPRDESTPNDPPAPKTGSEKPPPPTTL